MTKKHQIARSHQLPLGELDAVYVSEYKITTARIQDRHYKRPPRRVKDACERLYDESQTRPLEVIPELLDRLL